MMIIIIITIMVMMMIKILVLFYRNIFKYTRSFTILQSKDIIHVHMFTIYFEIQ